MTQAGRPPAPAVLPHPVIDNHCHLEMAAEPRLNADDPWTATQALDAAERVGVSRIVQIGCDVPSAGWSVALAQTDARVVAGVALHPNEAPRLGASGELERAWSDIAALATHKKVRAVGETGLDYFRTDLAGRDLQQESFRRHIRLAADLHKTLVIHDRDAHDDVVRIVDEEARSGSRPPRVVMHCFSGDTSFAQRCLERGFWLSFSGTVTFKNAGEVREAMLATPADRLLVETDAPFLTPAPHRGRPNAAYLLPLTVRFMAQARSAQTEMSDDQLAEFCRQVEANTFDAFGGPWG